MATPHDAPFGPQQSLQRGGSDGGGKAQPQIKMELMKPGICEVRR